LKADGGYLPYSKTCFVCGEDNPAGLRTRFFVEDGVVKMRLAPETHHCGYHNTVHGGVIAAALDECMGWAATLLIKRMCYTAELVLRYLKPVPADRETVVTTKVIRAGKRLAHVHGQLSDSEGEVYVRAEGRFVPLSIEQTLEVDDYLIYGPNVLRVFDGLREEAGQGQT